jgi:alpha-glucosidase
VTFSISDSSKVRIGILAPDVARVRVAPDGVFGTNVSRAVVAADWPATSFEVTEDATAVRISTSAMKLVARKTPFVLECRDAADNLILSDDPIRRVQWGSSRTQVYKTTQSNEKYVGLGWRALPLVRNGTTFHMRNVPTYNDPAVFYSGIPFWYGLRGKNAYGIFFDDTSWGTIDAGATSGSYMSFKNLGGTLDYYYFAGPTMAGILDRYTALTGRPFMPPRWALGFQQSRWSYTPQSQVLDIATQFRTRNIPCDVLHLDIDYMPGGRALTFDSSKFPSPANMLATLHNQGFHVVANISPLLFTDDPKYSTARNNGYLLRKADGNVLHGWHDYWYFVGGAGTGSLAWIDFSRTPARDWWAGQHASFLNYGIDGIWNDLNEPDELGGAWPSDVKYDFDGSPVNHHRTSVQYPLLQTELSYSILAGHYPDRRPFVLSRGGYAGIQRVSAVWSGDNRGDWVNDYRNNIPMGLSMSICGQPHNGHDIGGFFGHPAANSAPSGELYARWMQAGVFSPFCRQHHDGWGNHDPGRPFVEPWQFGDTVETICREFIGLRYRLMPYLYTLFYRAATTGEPVQRPTLFDFPADPNTLTQDDDFMFGPSLLVSPVTTPGATTWSTYLPAGAQWINWWDDSEYAGGQTVTTAAPLDQLPIFVREGAIIPMRPVVQYDGEAPATELTLELFPADAPSSFTLYEDDGISWDYQSGGFASTTYTMSGLGDTFRLEIAAREGAYVPAARHYLLKVHRWPGSENQPSLNAVALSSHNSQAAFEAAAEGYYFDAAAGLLYARFADTGGSLTFALDVPIIPNVPGDFDRDGDVDQEDFGEFQACLSGPGAAQDDPDCGPARMDGDTDVDGEDLARFVTCMSGAGVVGEPDCAD